MTQTVKSLRQQNKSTTGNRFTKNSAQVGGPTMSNANGVGVPGTVKRTESRTPKIAHSHTTSPRSEEVVFENFNDGYKAGDIVHWKVKPTHSDPTSYNSGEVIKPLGRGSTYLVKRHDALNSHIAIKHSQIIHHHRPIGEARESEYMANKNLANTPKKKPKPDDYFSHNDKKIKSVKEDAPAMSVGSGAAVPTITDPTTNYAFQERKKKYKKILSRPAPK